MYTHGTHWDVIKLLHSMYTVLHTWHRLRRDQALTFHVHSTTHMAQTETWSSSYIPCTQYYIHGTNWDVIKLLHSMYTVLHTWHKLRRDQALTFHVHSTTHMAQTETWSSSYIPWKFQKFIYPKGDAKFMWFSLNKIHKLQGVAISVAQQVPRHHNLNLI